MASLVEFATYRRFKKTELSKEGRLEPWNRVQQRADFKFRIGEKVEDIKKGDDDILAVLTNNPQRLRMDLCRRRVPAAFLK
jgi:hypothetical protein